jgi:hypothetical protein
MVIIICVLVNLNSVSFPALHLYVALLGVHINLPGL